MKFAAKRIVLFTLILLFSLLFYGCAIKVSSNYPPSILLDGEGEVNISDFSYTPDGFEFDDEKRKYFKRSKGPNDEEYFNYIEPYEVYTGGLSPVYIDKSISEFVSNAIRKELKFIGYKNSPDCNRIISGTVREISVDYIGLSTVDFVTRIEFNISNGSDKKSFSKIGEGRFSSSKWTTMELNSGIYTSIAKAIEDFVRSAQGNGAL